MVSNNFYLLDDYVRVTLTYSLRKTIHSLRSEFSDARYSKVNTLYDLFCFDILFFCLIINVS